MNAGGKYYKNMASYCCHVFHRKISPYTDNFNADMQFIKSKCCQVNTLEKNWNLRSLIPKYIILLVRLIVGVSTTVLLATTTSIVTELDEAILVVDSWFLSVT